MTGFEIIEAAPQPIVDWARVCLRVYDATQLDGSLPSRGAA